MFKDNNCEHFNEHVHIKVIKTKKVRNIFQTEHGRVRPRSFSLVHEGHTSKESKPKETRSIERENNIKSSMPSF